MTDQNDEIIESEQDNEEDPKKSSSITVAGFMAESRMEFSGPIPPPNILRQYEDILPGATDRILTMAEAQSKHRQHMEKTVVEGDTKRSAQGLWAGTVIVLATLAFCAYLAKLGSVPHLP